MKHLILCRHSKTESQSDSGRDHDRKLTRRGAKDASAVGKALVRRGILPDRVLASDSRRTRETTALICAEFSRTPSVLFLPDLYSGTMRTILDTAVSNAEGGQTILLVGHNPGMEAAACQLAGQQISLPTSTAVVFRAENTAPEDSPLERLRLVEILSPGA